MFLAPEKIHTKFTRFTIPVCGCVFRVGLGKVWAGRVGMGAGAQVGGWACVWGECGRQVSGSAGGGLGIAAMGGAIE